MFTRRPITHIVFTLVLFLALTTFSQSLAPVQPIAAQSATQPATAAASAQSSLQVITPDNVAQLKPVTTIGGLKNGGISLTFSADGQMLAMGGDDKIVLVWNMAAQKSIYQLDAGGQVYGLAFSLDSKTLISLGIESSPRQSIIRFWDVSTGKQTTELKATANASVSSIAISPDGKTLAAGTRAGNIELWDAVKGKKLNVLNGTGHIVPDLVFSPDGKILAVGGENLILWDAAKRSKLPSLKGDTSRAVALSFSSDGKSLAAVSSIDGLVRQWDIATGKALTTLQEEQDELWTVAFSPNGKLVAAGSVARAAGESLFLWDSMTGKLLASFKANQNVYKIAFSPDGKILAVTGFQVRSDNVQLWGIPTTS